MRKLLLLLPAIWISALLFGQAGQINQINIVNFTVKNSLPGTVDSWLSTPGALLLTAQKVPGAQVREPMMVLQVRSNGAIICGNTMATAKRVDPFDVRVFTTADLLGLLGNCHELKAGTYSLCVQFFNIDKVAVSREVCKDFRVEDTNIDYAPPTLITPDNGKKIPMADLAKPIQFRWTPLVPKPKEPVTYRLRVWQLMQGQNGTAAMRSNTPVIDKEVKEITQATVTNILTGPCKPPYLCDFIWNVQAINREGKPMGRNNGFSEAWTFSADDGTASPPVNTSPENNKQLQPNSAINNITFRWTPLVPKPSAPITYRLKVWQLMQGQNGTQAMRSNQPIVTKDVDNITEAVVSGIYTGPCRPPYLCEFIWNVQVVTRDGTAGASSEPTTFSVAETKSNGPDNSFPEDKKELSIAEAKNPIRFRWTPVVPKPQEAVTYRLKVWQLMQGQNGTQAMRSNQPIVTKDVDNITEAVVSGIYTGPCRPPYLCEFIWNVQVVTRDGTAGASSEPTTFSVAETKSNGPDNSFPEDKKEFTIAEAKNPIRFRWTPVVPKPQEAVTYRLKVWQLMQGQNGTQAMRSNQPIVTKDVDNITEATVSDLYTGPCRPPYLCEFIWNVEATVRQQGAAPKIIGTSSPTTFSVAPQYIIQLDSIKVLCTPTPGIYSFSYTISNVNPGTATLTNLAITSSVPAGATLGTFTPPIGTAINTGNQLTITGTINAALNLSNICIGAEITDVANNFWKASRDTCIPVLPCKCDVCDSVKIEVNPKGEITLDTAGNIIQNNTITVSPKPVKNIKAELVYFEYKPDSDDCMICNKDSKTYGNFIGASTGLVSPTIPFGHTVNWAPNGQMVTNQALNFVISMPPTVKCCAATVKWCIRYVVTFMDCTVCNTIVCYEYKKKCECK
jgi:hypothetical protein